MHCLAVRVQVAIVALVGVLGSAVESRAQVDLFSPVDRASGASPASPVPGITTLRDRLVRVAAGRLADARAEIADGRPAHRR